MPPADTPSITPQTRCGRGMTVRARRPDFSVSGTRQTVPTATHRMAAVSQGSAPWPRGGHGGQNGNNPPPYGQVPVRMRNGMKMPRISTGSGTAVINDGAFASPVHTHRRGGGRLPVSPEEARSRESRGPGSREDAGAGLGDLSVPVPAGGSGRASHELPCLSSSAFPEQATWDCGTLTLLQDVAGHQPGRGPEKPEACLLGSVGTSPGAVLFLGAAGLKPKASGAEAALPPRGSPSPPVHVHPAGDKPDEIVPASKPSRTAETVAVESRVATIKQRPTSRCFPSVSDVNRPDPEPQPACARQAPQSSADPQWGTDHRGTGSVTRPGGPSQGPGGSSRALRPDPPTPCGTPYPARSRHPPSPGPGRRPEPGETGSRWNSLGARTRVSFGLRTRLFQVALGRREVRPASNLSSGQGSSGLGGGRTGKLFAKRRRDARGSSWTRRRRKDGQPACRGAHVPQGTALGLSPALGHCGQPTVRRRTWPRSDPTAHRQSVYERQGIAVMTPTVPGSPKGPFLGLPREWAGGVGPGPLRTATATLCG
ncbi:hypothetical protein J1605_002383 [Eschrichtius robustus]|uniref:Uncharacterized protein n=1 Tax=Eschrichtius robustus TaxID=9764 RepID=A0AB34HXC3_ESCRO|nr:hypothetical protein J1605_002383 [Eschrichtius robustus]